MITVSKTIDILTKGIETLRQSDEDINRLIYTRSNDVISLLDRYIKEIELFNSAYGLVGTDDTEELVIKHILDSLAPLGIIYRLCKNKLELKIADAGSGAGLPGIPLAIAMKDFDFTLIERMGRRAGFLYNTKAVLELSNITVEEGELEKTQKGYFDLITFRAFKPLEHKMLKTLFKACKNTGIIAAYKGKLVKIEQEMKPLENECQWKTISYNVPFLEDERHLLIITNR
jgi:16S rRNA (guanine527-N7)-methyltransferase